MKRNSAIIQLLCVLSITAPACQNTLDPGKVEGQDHEEGPQAPLPDVSASDSQPKPLATEPNNGSTADPNQTPDPAGTPTPTPTNAKACAGNTDPNHICVAVRYVVYRDSTDAPIVSEAEAQAVVDGMNALWSQCNLAFQIDQYLPIRPADHGLRYQTANYSELTDIRNTFMQADKLLMVTTGTWDRTGSLGNTGANAWTTMPGSGPFGAILERPVGKNTNLIAHEMGHYLNLVHASDTYAMMNPIIYAGSQNIYDSQCATARSAAKYYWSDALR